jgi:hypothetical protein
MRLHPYVRGPRRLSRRLRPTVSCFEVFQLESRFLLAPVFYQAPNFEALGQPNQQATSTVPSANPTIVNNQTWGTLGGVASSANTGTVNTRFTKFTNVETGTANQKFIAPGAPGTGLAEIGMTCGDQNTDTLNNTGSTEVSPNSGQGTGYQRAGTGLPVDLGRLIRWLPERQRCREL